MGERVLSMHEVRGSMPRSSMAFVFCMVFWCCNINYTSFCLGLVLQL